MHTGLRWPLPKMTIKRIQTIKTEGKISMEDKDDSRTLVLLIAGMLIWFALLSVPVLLFTSDKLRCELGLLAGTIAGIAMAVSMNISASKVLYMENHQSSYLAWLSAIRLLVVAALIILFGFTGWVNVITMIAGVFGLKISVYINPVLQRVFHKKIKK